MSENVIIENKMGTMPEGKLILNVSLPVIASMLVQACYNIRDSVFVAKIGENALTAVSLAFTIQILLIALAAGTGTGMGTLISQSLGEKNAKKVKAVSANGAMLFVISYVVILLVGIFAVKPFYMAQLKGNDIEIVEMGISYLSIVCICSFGIFLQMYFERCLLSSGKSVYAMITQMTGTVINLVLDPILIFGLLGAPKLGVAGAAVATVAGQIVSGIMACIFNQKFNPEVFVSLKGFSPNKEIIKGIYKVGVPSIAMQAVGSIMNFGMNMLFMSISSTMAAVFGGFYRVESLFIMPIIGLNGGMTPIMSYNYGAGNKKRIINTLKWGHLWGFVLMFAAFFVMTFFPRALLSLFTPSEEMIRIGVPAFRIIGIHYIFTSYGIVSGALFQSVKKAHYTLIDSAARQVLLLLPLAYILNWMFGPDAIWYSFIISEIGAALIAFIYVKKIKRDIFAKMPD